MLEKFTSWSNSGLAHLIIKLDIPEITPLYLYKGTVPPNLNEDVGVEEERRDLESSDRGSNPFSNVVFFCLKVHVKSFFV